ncbi:MAG TPA: sigma-70 family RNA polymerase sigma factor [Vicinamibacteria bacterium]
MPLAALVGACRAEMGNFRRGEPSCEESCFEIVRRAVCERDQAAWDAVVAQYRGLVFAWIGQHPASSTLSEEAEYWVHCVFARFWAALGPERFGAFPSLGAVLRYLKLCAHSVLLDEVRRRAATPSEPLSSHEARLEAPDGPDAAVDGLAGRELWQAIGVALPDETERLVAHLCLALGMRPAEVHARFPERFPTAAAVYRVKRTLLDRLRRSPEVRRFLDE